MPGSTPPTSQLDWLSSTTAMIVLSWSKATRDLLKSFSWGIGALRQLFASDDGAISSPPAPYHLSAGGRWIRPLGPPVRGSFGLGITAGCKVSITSFGRRAPRRAWGLRGGVRNRSDASVEALVTGARPSR